MSDEIIKYDDHLERRNWGESDVRKSIRYYPMKDDHTYFKETFFQKDGETAICDISSSGSFTPHLSLGHVWHGNSCYVRGDGKETLYFTADTQKGLFKFFREDGKTVEWTIDTNGNETYYREGGKTVSYTRDKDGNEIYYREDGKTLSYTRDKDGNEVHYKKDGKNVDYYARDGIRNNMVAENRKKLATKFGLRDVKLPRWVKVAEEKVSRKVEIAKNKVTTKTKTTTKKSIKTNNGRS